VRATVPRAKVLVLKSPATIAGPWRGRASTSARLSRAAGRRVAHLQVRAREHERPARGLHLGHDADAAAIALLVEVVGLETGREPHDARRLERVARKDRVPLQPDRVLAGRLQVGPDPFRQLEVGWGERPVHPEPLGQVAPFFPQADAVFADATTLDTTIDMLDPQPPLVERLVRPLLLPRELLAGGVLGRHQDLQEYVCTYASINSS
jgi:hypothetical protein